MPKVVAINSSSRKMNTYKLIAQVKQILENNNIDVEIINLFDFDIKTCIGCEHCLVKGGCVLKDQALDIMNKIKSSDGIILSSPVYMENVSGKLKTFVDRTCSWFHRPEIYGKPVLILSTTKGSGLKSTLRYLERVVVQWGGFYTGKISRTIGSINNAVTEDECKDFIRHLYMNKENYRPSLQALVNFQIQRVLARKIKGLDGAYWEGKGWNHGMYYFRCRISTFKKLTASGFGSMLNKIINN